MGDQRDRPAVSAPTRAQDLALAQLRQGADWFGHAILLRSLQPGDVRRCSRGAQHVGGIGADLRGRLPADRLLRCLPGGTAVLGVVVDSAALRSPRLGRIVSRREGSGQSARSCTESGIGRRHTNFLTCDAVPREDAAMPRIGRVVVPGCPHHVFQRGNRRQRTFSCDNDDRAHLVDRRAMPSVRSGPPCGSASAVGVARLRQPGVLPDARPRPSDCRAGLRGWPASRHRRSAPPVQAVGELPQAVARALVAGTLCVARPRRPLPAGGHAVRGGASGAWADGGSPAGVSVEQPVGASEAAGRRVGQVGNTLGDDWRLAGVPAPAPR